MTLGLPTATALMVFGIPLFWVLYTLGFMWVSRHWKDEQQEKGRNDHE
ncbi:hypothetical protein GCM10011502_00790 [Oceanisphaera marina]|uniref:DUF3311 domain-containing protein n=1 Tax=Oceanisphaera marina TaxID=2017550 RepID=A0ABQ1IA98_9GAMM|nr:hypothetical protein [Oceanisphaera marina]GGB31655.1 hypothetical protein GCM10011502_00790 [Oceanisphaera marina]